MVLGVALVTVSEVLVNLCSLPLVVYLFSSDFKFPFFFSADFSGFKERWQIKP